VERPRLELTTARLHVQVPAVSAAPRILDYCLRNRAHLEPWEPPRPSEYYSLSFWRRQIAGARDEFENGHSLRTILVERDGSEVARFRKVHIPGHEDHEPWRSFQHLERR